MPAGPIANHNAVVARGNLGADLGQMRVHALCVGSGHDDRGARATRRTDRTEDVGRITPVIFDHRRAGSLRRPDVGMAALLSDPGFILEPDLDRLVGVLVPDALGKRGASFSHACIAAGSFLRCRGRGRR